MLNLEVGALESPMCVALEGIDCCRNLNPLRHREGFIFPWAGCWDVPQISQTCWRCSHGNYWNEWMCVCVWVGWFPHTFFWEISICRWCSHHVRSKMLKTLELPRYCPQKRLNLSIQHLNLYMSSIFSIYSIHPIFLKCNHLTVLRHCRWWWIREIIPFYGRKIQVSPILWFTQIHVIYLS